MAHGTNGDDVLPGPEGDDAHSPLDGDGRVRARLGDDVLAFEPNLNGTAIDTPAEAIAEFVIHATLAGSYMKPGGNNFVYLDGIVPPDLAPGNVVFVDPASRSPPIDVPVVV